jgi:membrane-bound serine protease (ClpP class)
MAIVLALVMAGAVLLFLETILPGLIAGILGVCLLIAGVALGYVNFGAEGGTWVLIAVGLLLLGGGAAYLKLFPETSVARRFISRGAIGSGCDERGELLGHDGRAQTTLRPSGKALIDGRSVDVVAEGAFIERGQAVRVVAVEGNRVVVRIA